MKYRARSILLAGSGDNLSDKRVLSLSNIFIITQKQSDSALHRFNPEHFNTVAKTIKRKEGWLSLPTPVRIWCTELDQSILSSDKLLLKKLRRLIREIGSTTDYDEDEDTSNNNNNVEEVEENIDDLSLGSHIFTGLVDKFMTWNDDVSTENGFTQQCLSPFLHHIFNRENISMRLGETHVCGLPDSLMADYVGSHKTSTGNEYDVVAVEVKPPNKTSSSHVMV